MALAELSEWKQYEPTYSFEEDQFVVEPYMDGKRKSASVSLNVTFPRQKRQMVIAKELRRIGLQARRPIAAPSEMTVSNRPSVSRWLLISLDVLSLISLSAVISGFFVFLVELSAGRPAFLVSGFSAIFIFTIVGVVSYRLKLAIRRLQSAV